MSRCSSTWFVTSVFVVSVAVGAAVTEGPVYLMRSGNAFGPHVMSVVNLTTSEAALVDVIGAPTAWEAVMEMWLDKCHVNIWFLKDNGSTNFTTNMTTVDVCNGVRVVSSVRVPVDPDPALYYDWNTAVWDRANGIIFLTSLVGPRFQVIAINVTTMTTISTITFAPRTSTARLAYDSAARRLFVLSCVDIGDSGEEEVYWYSLTYLPLKLQTTSKVRPAEARFYRFALGFFYVPSLRQCMTIGAAQIGGGGSQIVSQTLNVDTRVTTLYDVFTKLTPEPSVNEGIGQQFVSFDAQSDLAVFCTPCSAGGSTCVQYHPTTRTIDYSPVNAKFDLGDYAGPPVFSMTV